MSSSKSTRQQQLKRRRRKQIQQQILFFLFVLFIVCLVVGIFLIIRRPKVKKEITMEAGSELPVLSDFLLKDYENAKFAYDPENVINMNRVGDYEVVININDRDYTSVVHIEDTVAPVVKTKEIQVFNDKPIDPSDLIDSIDDATETKVEFMVTPDFSESGLHYVNLLVTDMGGNSVGVAATVEVIKDTEPPVITGVEELTIAAGSSVSYKRNVSVTDNYDKDVTLTVDSSSVDLNKQGDYMITYIAEDSAGNRTEVSTVLHVQPPSAETATEELVNAKADEILATIISNGMTQYEKAQAIFNWVYGNVAWLDGTPKENWVQGAYMGLYEQKGDCYVYAMTSKCLLTRAGIDNMDIGFENPNRTHYWNLIDIGEGWYHFDTTRRVDGRSFFYVSDADIQAYSSTHNGSHAYDPSLYPTIQ